MTAAKKTATPAARKVAARKARVATVQAQHQEKVRAVGEFLAAAATPTAKKTAAKPTATKKGK